MERFPESELDPGEDATYWSTRDGEPYTGIVFTMFEGKLSGEWECREGYMWGPERHFDEDGIVCRAWYHLAGCIHGFRREWSFGGKYTLYEYRFGALLRSRWWRPDGPVVDEDRTVGSEAANTVRYLADGERFITAMGGDFSEVPEPYLTLLPGEWDDPPAPDDAERWMARFG
ncbi:MAG TPA: hypothetical protein VHR66_06780 [Gemmataceae bacterium]|jgi:hypothetical protein|nr:hypothetical protein [Gemmataceae bacterium]